jgi:hypothetical protein
MWGSFFLQHTGRISLSVRLRHGLIEPTNKKKNKKEKGNMVASKRQVWLVLVLTGFPNGLRLRNRTR